MAISRNIIGSIRNAKGDLVASGTLKVKPLIPVTDGNTFISPEQVVVPISAGLFTLDLIAPCIYQFIIEDMYEASTWTFEATLSDDSPADISLATLYQTGRAEIDDTIDIITTFLELVDTPGSFIDQEGKTLTVNSAEDALEFTTPVTTFLDLLDTPVDFTGHAGKTLVVNSTEDGIEFI
jgi:hypothetical protein